MSHTPAEILRQYLTTGTGCPFDVPNTTGADWPLYVSLVPDADDPTEDQVASVLDTPGVIEDASMSTGLHLVHHGVQLIIRSKSYSSAYAKAREAIAWLVPTLNESVTITPSAYTINSVAHVGDISAEREDGHKRRHLFSVNFLVTLDGASGGTLSPRSLSANVSEALDLLSGATTRGAVLYRGASGWAALAPGTSGHFLKSNGAGADPSYAAAGGGTTFRVIASGAAVVTAGPNVSTAIGPYTRNAGERLTALVYPKFDGRISGGGDNPTEGVGHFFDNANGGGDEFNLVFWNKDSQSHDVDWTILGYTPA